MTPLLAKYADQSRWVNWRLKERDGKKTKVPYCAIGGKRALASSTDSDTWTDYASAHARSERVGIVFTPDKLLLGIDIDKCLNAEGRLIDDSVVELLAESDSYTEISPSDTGLHVYIALESPLTLEANRHGNFECYTSGRYFTVTGKSFGKTPKEIRTVSPEEALKLLASIGYPWKPVKTDADSKNKKQSHSTRTLSSDVILSKMFSASNGEAVRAIYDGDISQHGNDVSRADMALLLHFAFWTGKDAAQMEALWLASPAGSREKTQDREDYRTRSIGKAIEICSDVYNPDLKGVSETSLEDLKLLYFLKEKAKVYYKNTENISRIIDRHPNFMDTFRYDAYRSIIERHIATENGKRIWRILEDFDAVDVQTKISVLFSDFASVSKEMVYDAIIKVAYDNTIDSGADHIRSLVWDGAPRLDTWLHEAYGTPQDEYHAKVGANWLKGLVKRIIYPGCKFDYVLVLEGKQGIKKSTSLDVLAGELGHVETTISTDQKDFFLLMQGNAIIEFSEGETLSRTEVKQLKSVISTAVDKYRIPYGRATTAHPRRSVFAMTTNQTEYLKDETGNRRWLPVTVSGTANVEWLKENRGQILAEAYTRVVTKGETVHEFPEDELEQAQIERRVKDPNIDTIVNWYWSQPQSARENGISVSDLWMNALHAGFSTRPMTRIEEMSISDVLRTWLRLEMKRVTILGVRAQRFFPTEKTVLQQPSHEDMMYRTGVVF